MHPAHDPSYRTIPLAGAPLSIDDVVAVARLGHQVVLTEEARQGIARGRRVIEEILRHGDTMYVVNTGIGSLAAVRISPAQLLDLQRNLIHSHAAGVGDPLPEEVSRAMLLITAAGLARGYSGVRPTLVEALIGLHNAGVHPVIPWQGSLGPVTDNPLCFADEGEVFSGGNFHGRPIALFLDFLVIALTALPCFSERRIYALVGTWEGEAALPRYLGSNPGLQSGMIIAQYVAGFLVAENRVLAHPASVDSIPTSAGVEDFVSMGATAAWKTRRILENSTRAVVIEVLGAAQAMESRRPLRISPPIEGLLREPRSISPTLTTDRGLSADTETVARAIRQGDLRCA